MIPIIESVTTTFVTSNCKMVEDIVLSKEFSDFIKEPIFDRDRLGVNIALAINSIFDSALANPILHEVFYNGKEIDSVFIKLNNELWDLFNLKKYSDLDVQYRNLKHINVSASDDYIVIRNYIEDAFYNMFVNR